MSNKRTTASRKRQKIQQSNKTMFIMIAAASAIVGLSLVVAWLILQQVMFTSKLVEARGETLDNLKASSKNIETLSDNIRVLETNKGLNSLKASQHNKALQTILDALPADANSLALGASIQDKLAFGVNGLTIESLTVLTESESIDSEGSASSLPVRMTVTARRAEALQQLLERFEKSIRVIDIDNLAIERSEDRYTMTLDAHAYYEPAIEVKLDKKVVKP